MSDPLMTCPPATDLQLLLDGTLPESKTDELAAHLETCPNCREALDLLTAGDEWPVQVAKHLSQRGGSEPLPAAKLAERWRTPQPETALGLDGLERLEFLEPSEAPGVLGMLGHYEITETIGRGGFGLVLKGRDPRLNRIVAVKVLAPELASNAMARRRFLREAQAAAAVRHDHVVTIYAVDEFAKLPYLVMEYVPGHSLQERLDEQGPLEVREILRIGRQIALGLSAAHAEGLIHRDIKPGNVLLEDGVQRVKITDFGLARAVDDIGMTQTGTVAGTPEYMSPEQAWGGPVDHRTDLFSLGGVLYAMCTGRSPFRAKNVLAVLKRVCEDEPRPIEDVNPEIPYGLISVIERLLAKDPARRFSSAHDVAELLGNLLATMQNAETVPITPEPVPEKSIPPWLLSPVEKVPLDTWSWIVDRFHRANGWGLGLRSAWFARKRPYAPPEDRGVRWLMMLVIGGTAAPLLLIGVFIALASLERRHRADTATVVTASTSPQFVQTQPWSPPLKTTSELTLDIRDKSLTISIDGRNYPFEDTGKRVVSFGEGRHTIAVSDETRGEFDDAVFSTPTSKSDFRIDKNGIVQSTGPTNLDVEWIPSADHVQSLLFKGRDKRIFTWDSSTGGVVRTWPIGIGAGQSEGGSRVVVGDEYGGAAQAGEYEYGEFMVPQGNRSWTVSKNGDYLAVGGNDQNGEVRLYDVSNDNPSNWMRQLTVTRNAAGLREIVFSSDSRLLLCASRGRTEVFRLDDLIATKLGEIVPSSTSRGALGSEVVSARFLPDNQRVFLSDKDGNVEIWNTRPFRLENAFEANAFGWSGFQCIHFDPSGKQALLTYSNRLCLFDLEQGKVLAKPEWSGGESRTLLWAWFLPESEHALLVIVDRADNGNAEFQITHLETGRITARLNPADALRINTSGLQVHDLLFSPDGRTITFACIARFDPRQAIGIVNWRIPESAFADASTPRASKTEPLELIRTLPTGGEVASLSLTPDGEQIVTGDANGGPAALRRFSTGEIVHQLQGKLADGRGDSRVAVSPDGKRIAEGDGGILRVWHAETGELQFETRLSDPIEQNGQSIERVNAIRSVAWSVDGQRLLIACPRPAYQEGNRVKTWHAGSAFLVEIDDNDAKVLKRFDHPGDVTAAMFLGDGRKFVTACRDGRVRIWEADSDEPRREFPTGTEAVLCLDATTDGNYVAAGSEDGTWHLWETRFGQKIDFRLSESAVTALKFLPQDDRLATGHRDGSLAVWNLPDRSELVRIPGSNSITALAILPDGKHLLAARTRKTENQNPGVEVWKIPAAD